MELIVLPYRRCWISQPLLGAKLIGESSVFKQPRVNSADDPGSIAVMIDSLCALCSGSPNYVVLMYIALVERMWTRWQRSIPVCCELRISGECILMQMTIVQQASLSTSPPHLRR